MLPIWEQGTAVVNLYRAALEIFPPEAAKYRVEHGPSQEYGNAPDPQEIFRRIAWKETKAMMRNERIDRMNVHPAGRP